MKRYFKIIIIAIIIGSIIAILFYFNLNKEIKNVLYKEELIYLFQVGVYKNYKNALTMAKNYNTSLIYKDDSYYRVIIAATTSESLEKQKNIFDETNIDYYIKKKRVDKKTLEEIKKYESAILKTEKKEVIDNLNNSILNIIKEKEGFYEK